MDEVDRYGITDIDGYAAEQRLQDEHFEKMQRSSEEFLKVLRLKIDATKRHKRAEKILKKGVDLTN